MIPFIGEPRINWVKERYEKYQRRQHRGYGALLLSGVDVLFLLFVQPLTSSDIRILADQIGTIILLGLLGLTGFLINRELSDYLPEIEDRLLCFLKPGLDSLRAYETYGKGDDKKKALKKLEGVADVLEGLDSGNLKFIRSGPIGKMLSDVQKNFRGGLIFALRSGDKTKVRDIVNAVANMENGVEGTNAISEDTLRMWQMVLSRYPSPEPSKPLWRKLPAKKFHLSMALMVLGVPIVVGVVGVDVLHVPIEAAYLGTISTFAAMVVIVIYILGKRKPS